MLIRKMLLVRKMKGKFPSRKIRYDQPSPPEMLKERRENLSRS